MSMIGESEGSWSAHFARKKRERMELELAVQNRIGPLKGIETLSDETLKSFMSPHAIEGMADSIARAMLSARAEQREEDARIAEGKAIAEAIRNGGK